VASGVGVEVTARGASGFSGRELDLSAALSTFFWGKAITSSKARKAKIGGTYFIF
jgi:hypothetical protein